MTNTLAYNNFEAITVVKNFIIQEPDVTNFFFVTDVSDKQASAFVHVDPFQPCPIFEGKSCNLPSRWST